VVLGQQEFAWISLQESENFLLHAYPVLLLATDLVQVFLTLLVLGALAGIYPAITAYQHMKKAVRLTEN